LIERKPGGGAALAGGRETLQVDGVEYDLRSTEDEMSDATTDIGGEGSGVRCNFTMVRYSFLILFKL